MIDRNYLKFHKLPFFFFLEPIYNDKIVDLGIECARMDLLVFQVKFHFGKNKILFLKLTTSMENSNSLPAVSSEELRSITIFTTVTLSKYFCFFLV